MAERVYKGNPKHGGRRTPEYSVWIGIKTRCFNSKDPNFSNYGARGITMYEGWAKDFPAFLAEVGPRPSEKHTLERIDVNKGYEPGNVRWATRAEQTRNTRNNRVVEYQGQTVSLTQLADDLLIPINVIHKRLYKGKAIGDAIAEGYEPYNRARLALKAVDGIPDEALEAGVIEEVKTALQEILKMEGPFKQDRLEHAYSVLKNIEQIAAKALSKLEGRS